MSENTSDEQLKHWILKDYIQMYETFHMKYAMILLTGI